VKEKVRIWYNNSSGAFRTEGVEKASSGKVKMKRHDAKSVARDMHSDRYAEIKKRLSEEGVIWNEIHRRIMAELWEELSEEDQLECREKAHALNTGDVSEIEQRR
jgi:hypothetical protein